MQASSERILLIEDDPDGAEAFKLLLEFWGYGVEVADELDLGLALASAQSPDAILLDLGMPTVEAGCAFVQRIRAFPDGDAILVIAVTGHGRGVDRRRAIGAGCDFFFVKPADPDQVREALTTIPAHREWTSRARRR